MKFQPIQILLVLHIILSVISVFFILSGKTSMRKELIIPVIILPIFGPLMALTIGLLNISGEQGKKNLDLEPLTPDEDILWKTLKSYHEKGNIVPLEEAILIDDVRTRRKFMLETLYEDPLKYLDILMLAKNNEDVETSHYATTTISHAQRSFQVAIQKLAYAVESYPSDMVLLDKYIEMLGKYMESGLLEEHSLKNMRIIYKKVLDKKLDCVKNDKQALIRKLRNTIELNEYPTAFVTSDLLKKYWPEDEQTWIEAVHVCVEGKDINKLHETVEEIQHQKIIWTDKGKEQITPWLKGITL